VQAGDELASPPSLFGAGGDGVEVDKDAPACDVAAAMRPGSVPGPACAAGREAHAAIQATIPRATSTPRPCRHPPLPVAAALRSCSYRWVNAPRSSPAMSPLMEPDWSEAFGRSPGGLLAALLVLAAGGAASLQRPLDRTRMHADAGTLPDRGGQIGRPQAGVGRQQLL
jgi:hypothetical protein